MPTKYFYVILCKLYELNVWRCSSIHSFIHLLTADTQIGDLKFLTEDIEKSVIWWAALLLPRAMRCEVLTAVLLKIQGLWDVVPCWLVIPGQCLRWALCRHFQSLAFKENFLICAVCSVYSVQWALTVLYSAACVCILFILMPQPHWKLGCGFCMRIGCSKFWSRLPH